MVTHGPPPTPGFFVFQRVVELSQPKPREVNARVCFGDLLPEKFCTVRTLREGEWMFELDSGAPSCTHSVTVWSCLSPACCILVQHGRPESKQLEWPRKRFSPLRSGAKKKIKACVLAMIYHKLGSTRGARGSHNMVAKLIGLVS